MAFQEKGGKNFVRVIESKEGTRMGCPAGSVGFNIAEDVFVFKELKRRFPRCEIGVLTDDCQPAFPPPMEGESWEDIYNMIAEFWAAYDELGNPIGLFRNPDKSELKLPIGAPVPLNIKRAGGITLKVNKEYVLVGGAPVGCDDDRCKHAAIKVENAKTRIDAVLTLARRKPHLAWRMLGSSANAALDYYARVVPPRLLMEEAKSFDQHMKEARWTILTDEYLPPAEMSTERENRANLIACLPAGCGGTGHVPITLR